MLLIDMQESFMEDTGQSNGGPKAARMKELLLFGRANNYPIYVIEVDPYEAGETIPYFQDVVKGYPLARTITKMGSSAFKKMALQLDLRAKHVESVVLMGLVMNYCVLDTARDAHALGFEVITSPNVMIGLWRPDSFYVNHCRLYDDRLQIVPPAQSTISHFAR